MMIKTGSDMDMYIQAIQKNTGVMETKKNKLEQKKPMYHPRQQGRSSVGIPCKSVLETRHGRAEQEFVN
jgi:hypothetical protein